MRTFACVLLLIFMIFFNSVHSGPQPSGDPNQERNMMRRDWRGNIHIRNQKSGVEHQLDPSERNNLRRAGHPLPARPPQPAIPNNPLYVYRPTNGYRRVGKFIDGQIYRWPIENGVPELYEAQPGDVYRVASFRFQYFGEPNRGWRCLSDSDEE